MKVTIKSSQFRNSFVTGTRIGLTNNYAFTYTPPAIAHGDRFDACNTTIVAYVGENQNASNDLMDDNLLNGSSGSAAGFRFVDGSGHPIDCTVVGTTSSTWGTLKKLFD